MVIALRILTLRGQGRDIEVPIRIFKPEEEKKNSWSCKYEIVWPDGPRTMTAWGVDSVQSIFIAFQMIGSEIYTSNFHKSGQLYFDTPGGGYGFPVPTSLRDLLRGADARLL